MDIKSIYSHKNILTSAIFVKIPFALFLITYHTGWKRILGYITAVLSVVAILMLSTRAFYLGLVLLIICLIIFYMLRQRSAGNKKIYLITFRWAGMLVLAILAYSVVQRFVFPSNTDSIWNTTVVSRIGSISANESSTKARLDSWQRTVQLIRDHPLLGTGTGNWKIAVLQYENQTSPDFLYMYKNHNDFLETTAETGMVGGVLFLMIILLCIRSIATSTLNDTDEAINGALFLSGFGMIAYSVDAFFNFPSDRPEIQIMFALFLAIAIACSERRYTLKLKALETSHIQKAVKPVNYFLSALSLLLIAVSVYILFLNVRSLYFQKICYSEINNKRLMHNAVVIEQGFPKIPSVTSFGEPVSILISRYLMNERKFQEAIELLKKDHSSPWDSRREYYLAKYYYELQEFDSAITWSLRALPLKPLHVNTVLTIGKLLYMKNQNQHALKILTTYLDNNPYDPRVWVLAANHHVALRQRNEAISLLDMAMIYLPADSTVTNLRKRLSTRQQ